MASTTQRNKARVAALKLPKMVQTSESLQVERSLKRIVDDLEEAIEDLTWDLEDAEAEIKDLKKRHWWYLIIYIAYAVFTLVACVRR